MEKSSWYEQLTWTNQEFKVYWNFYFTICTINDVDRIWWYKIVFICYSIVTLNIDTNNNELDTVMSTLLSRNKNFKERAAGSRGYQYLLPISKFILHFSVYLYVEYDCGNHRSHWNCAQNQTNDWMPTCHLIILDGWGIFYRCRSICLDIGYALMWINHPFHHTNQVAILVKRHNTPCSLAPCSGSWNLCFDFILMLLTSCCSSYTLQHLISSWRYVSNHTRWNNHIPPPPKKIAWFKCTKYHSIKSHSFLHFPFWKIRVTHIAM